VSENFFEKGSEWEASVFRGSSAKPMSKALELPNVNSAGFPESVWTFGTNSEVISNLKKKVRRW
jgi:hypothetical protein